MYATALIPALIVTLGRFFIVESPNWLAVRGEHEKAEMSVTRLLHREPRHPTNVILVRPETAGEQSFVLGAVQRAQPPRHHLFFGAVVHTGPIGTYSSRVALSSMLAGGFRQPLICRPARASAISAVKAASAALAVLT